MTNLIAMGDLSTHLTPHVLYSTVLILMMSLVMPVVAIAVIVKKSMSPEVRNSTTGLGAVSLHDELDEFIAAVESGDISLQSLENEGAHGRAGASPKRTVISPGN